MGLFKEEEKTEVVKEEKKQKKKSQSTEPWKPGSLLSYTGKDPNFRYRWCSKSALSKREAEGWEVVQDKRGNIVKDTKKTALDGNPVASTVELRELILMRMPKERAEARDKYYAELSSDRAKANIQQFENEAASVASGYDGGGAYGNIKIEQEEREE